MASCDGGAAANALWTWNAETKLLKSGDSGFCLDDKSGTTGVHMWGCSASNTNQHWEWDSTTKLVHSSKGKCLSTPSAANVGAVLDLAECDLYAVNQQWAMSPQKSATVAPPTERYTICSVKEELGAQKIGLVAVGGDGQLQCRRTPHHQPVDQSGEPSHRVC
jgi:hypothetical protein